jgi:hypothetical protein
VAVCRLTRAVKTRGFLAGFARLAHRNRALTRELNLNLCPTILNVRCAALQKKILKIVPMQDLLLLRKKKPWNILEQMNTLDFY